jgi:hypothetical protein
MGKHRPSPAFLLFPSLFIHDQITLFSKTLTLAQNKLKSPQSTLQTKPPRFLKQTLYRQDAVQRSRPYRRRHGRRRFRPGVSCQSQDRIIYQLANEPHSVVTVYACSATPSGVASPTVASTGGATPAAPTGSPIPYATGAASANGVSALGLIVAGGVALVSIL